jgi:N-acetylglutamate synthase-like GNAT family acetyltransferase
MSFKNETFEKLQFKKSDCLKLNHFYKQHREKSRAKPTDSIYVAIEGDVIQAGLRLLSYDDYYFLRSVFTTPAIRGQGIASKLLAHAIGEYTQPIYTLPTSSAVGLYQRLGFKAVDTKDIPARLSSSYRRFRQPSQDPTVMVINI